MKRKSKSLKEELKDIKISFIGKKAVEEEEREEIINNFLGKKKRKSFCTTK